MDAEIKMTIQEAEDKGLLSQDVAEEKRKQLKQLFPEVITEDKIDFEQLRRVMGDWVEPDKERYGLNWPGKAKCMKVIQAPSIATLKPERDESVDFDDTENLFIEGDNLEVLKLLQKAYFGKIKMIYIDPPYNTGKEFIYPDKYQEHLDTYLAYTSQVDDEGKKFSTNTDTSGRFHANWLNMMYPRIYLARNLLSESGSIFISIDENELFNLKLLCDFVFGPNNFCGLISRATGTRMGVGSSTISSELDYILIYSKTEGLEFKGLPMSDEEMKIYDQEDERGRYLARSLRRTGGENRREDRPSMFFPVEAPDGTEVYPIAPAGYESRWICGKDTYKKLLDEGFIEWKKVNKNGYEKWQVYQKHYLGSALKQPSNLWNNEEGNKKATRDLNNIFDNKKVFDHPKPVGLMRKIISLSTTPSNGDIVLDFFAGSASTAHALIEQNLSDSGNRTHITVQLPEVLDTENKAQEIAAAVCDELGVLRTVSELAKERLRRAAKKISQKIQGRLDLERIDLGFKVFKLNRSNFAIWDGDVDKVDDLAKQLGLHVDHIDQASGPEDILYELLLKAGFELTTKVEKQTMAGKDVYAVADGALLICLDKEITPQLIDALADANPLQVICLDEGFKGNDQLKTNAVQTFKSRAKEDGEATVFRTV